jgi:hypothetical protein
MHFLLKAGEFLALGKAICAGAAKSPHSRICYNRIKVKNASSCCTEGIFVGGIFVPVGMFHCFATLLISTHILFAKAYPFTSHLYLSSAPAHPVAMLPDDAIIRPYGTFRPKRICKRESICRG